MASDNNIKLKKDLIPIYDVVSNYIDLKRQGRYWVACCPFHNEHHPSFTLSDQTNLFYCYGCKAWGNAVQFVMRYRGCSYREALKEIKSYGIDVTIPYRSECSQRQSLDQLCNRFQSQLSNASYYLKQRNISQETARSYKLGYYKNRLILTLFDMHGSCLGFSSRALDKSLPVYSNPRESSLFTKSKYLYGLHNIVRYSDQLLVVEGYFDVLTLHQHGYDAVALCGTAVSDHQIRTLLLKGKPLFCFDGDKAGLKAVENTVIKCLNFNLFQSRTIRICFLPMPYDPDSFLNKYSKDIFDKIIKDSINVIDFIGWHVADMRRVDTIAYIHSICRRIKSQVNYKYLVDHLLDKQILTQQDVAFLPSPSAVDQLTKKSQSLTVDIFDKPIAFMMQYPSLCATIIGPDINHHTQNVLLFNTVQRLIKHLRITHTQDLVEYLTKKFSHDIIYHYLSLNLIDDLEVLTREVSCIVGRIRVKYK